MTYCYAQKAKGMARLTYLLAEIKEYQQLREDNALDDEGEWNFWMECHPAFAAYWAWEQALSATDRDLAFLMSDEQRARWYCEYPAVREPPSPPIAAPATPRPIVKRRQHRRRASPLQVDARPRTPVLPIPLAPSLSVPNPPAIIVTPRSATMPAPSSPQVPIAAKTKASHPSVWEKNAEEMIKVVLIIAAITIGLWYVGQLDWAAIGRVSGSGGGYPSGPAGIPAYGSDGCGSRGGPGYRLTNGKCASWDDFYTTGPPREEPDIDYDAPHCWTPRDCE